MAERQYIGARYVPKLFKNPNGTNDWLPGIPYETLTIVTFLGNSYTSRKPVPAGIDILNSEYWVLTGNYNAQIENYREDVESFRVDLQHQISENRKDIDNINRKRKILFIGDSYGNQLNDAGKNYAELASNLLDCDFETSFVNGSGFTGINNGHTFIEQLQSITSNRESFTDICVCGGCNDFANSNAVLAAIKIFCDYAHENFKNAKIWVGHIGNFTDNQDNRRTRITTTSLPAYRNCMEAKASYLQNTEYILMPREYIGSDFIHPTAVGVDMLGKYIAEALLNGSCNVSYRKQYNATPASGLTVNNIANVIAVLHNDLVSLQHLYLLGSFTRAENFSGVTEIPLFTNFCPYGFGNYTNNLACPVVIDSLEGEQTNRYYGSVSVNDKHELFLRCTVGTSSSRLIIYTLGNLVTNTDSLR